jgi:ferric iron reductase protein FhuF
VFEAMQDAIRHHAAPVIEAMATTGKVSPKLLWSNLAVYADWAIREFGAEDQTLQAAALDLVTCETWPDGWRNPMSGQLRRENDTDGACFTRRKVCCLRYLLPGVPGCGMICPLPAGRA